MASIPATSASFNFGYHLVVYIDLPGQRRELEKIRRVPQTDEERQATVLAIKQSAVRVREIRSFFTEMLTGLMKVNPTVVEKLPQQARDSFWRFRAIEIRHVGFSDTFVISVPLTLKGEPEGIARTITAVWGVLVTAAAVSLLAMRRHIPLRGGLTIGTAVDLFENEAYGAALMDAYRLESEMAQYNRIIIGPEVFGYLNEIERSPQDDLFGSYARNKARECSQMICYAPDDNLPMVHVLSPIVMNLPTEAGTTWEELRAPAREWVLAEAQRFAETRDYKHWGRYARLLRYFEAYAPPHDQ